MTLGLGLLENKVALITGGTSGIGRASALHFAEEGARIAVTGRRKAEGEDIVEQIRRSGGEATFIQADLMDIQSIPATVAAVVDRYGRLDVAFNNAGISGGGPVETLTESVWDDVMTVNLKAAFFCLQAEVAQMRWQGGGGSILFNSSILAMLGFMGTSIYGASKGGLTALARAAAVELGPDGIRVNCVNPSITHTPMVEAYISVGLDGRESHPVAPADSIPLGRLASAVEVAKVAAFLLSDRSSYVTGQAWVIDGGQSVT